MEYNKTNSVVSLKWRFQYGATESVWAKLCLGRQIYERYNNTMIHRVNIDRIGRLFESTLLMYQQQYLSRIFEAVLIMSTKV